jgi:hypothetical protein
VALVAAQVGEMGCGNILSRDYGSWRAPRTYGTKPLCLAIKLETDPLRTGGMVRLWPAGRQIRKEISDFPREPGSTAAVRIRLVATKLRARSAGLDSSSVHQVFQLTLALDNALSMYAVHDPYRQTGRGKETAGCQIRR